MKPVKTIPVIPVIDLLGGVAVQAVRGERAQYRPVESLLCPGCAPVAIAGALRSQTNSRALYVADLDAILSGRGNRETLLALAREPDCDLWVDAGVSDPDGALRVLEAGAGQVVVGTECLTRLNDLESIAKALASEKILVSLDVRHGVVLSKAPGLAGEPPLAGLTRLAGLGFDRFILLTLDGVGTGGGADWKFLEPARRQFPGATLIAGGGVRSPDELRRAAALGLDGVLAATALHRGWITARDLVGAPDAGA